MPLRFTGPPLQPIGDAAQHPYSPLVVRRPPLLPTSTTAIGHAAHLPFCPLLTSSEIFHRPGGPRSILPSNSESYAQGCRMQGCRHRQRSHKIQIGCSRGCSTIPRYSAASPYPGGELVQAGLGGLLLLAKGQLLAPELVHGLEYLAQARIAFQRVNALLQAFLLPALYVPPHARMRIL